MDGKTLRLPAGETRQIEFIGKVAGDVAIARNFCEWRLLPSANILYIGTARTEITTAWRVSGTGNCAC